MTLAQFEMHRPRLARSLLVFVGSGIVESVLPEYEDEQLFSALVMEGPHDKVGKVAICVKSTHPMAMYEEDTPGEPTWWWQSDLESL